MNNINEKAGKHFSKEELLFIEKYPRLLGICTKYNIPFKEIDKAHKQYLSNIDIFLKLNSLYPDWWLGKDRNSFTLAVYNYFISKEHGKEYTFGTRGHISDTIVKLSELDKYIDENVKIERR